MSNNDVIFADGFIFKRRDNAPDFVIGDLSINLESARETFKHAKNGWLNLQVKLSKGGNYYVQVDTWEPDAKKAQAEKEKAKTETLDDDIPF